MQQQYGSNSPDVWVVESENVVALGWSLVKEKRRNVHASTAMLLDKYGSDAFFTQEPMASVWVKNNQAVFLAPIDLCLDEILKVKSEVFGLLVYELQGQARAMSIDENDYSTKAYCIHLVTPTYGGAFSLGNPIIYSACRQLVKKTLERLPAKKMGGHGSITDMTVMTQGGCLNLLSKVYSSNLLYAFSPEKYCEQWFIVKEKWHTIT